MLKPYPKYKDSEIWCLDRVPVNWDVYRVKNLFKLREEKNYAPLSEVNLISVYTALGVIQHDEIENTTGNKAVNADGYKIVYPNDIVVNIILCWMGAIGYSQFQGVTSPAYDVYCPIKDLNIRYYNYYFRTSLFTGECYRRGKGIMAMRWRTYSDQFTDIKIPTPPRPEQDAIVAYLDDKTEKIDRLIGLYKREIELLKERRQAVIHKAVTRGLDDKVNLKDSGVSWIGMVPVGWGVKRLKRLFSFGKGLPITKADLIPTGLAVISYGQIHSKKNSGVCVSDELIRYVDNSYIKSNRKSQVFTGDFIFADTSEDIEGCGNCVYVDNVTNPIFAGYHSIILRSHNRDNNKYLAYLFLTNDWRRQIREKVDGVKVFSISRRILDDTTIILPPRSEQDAIVAYLDDQCAKVDTMIGKVQSKIGLLEEYRVRLISDVVTGKVRV